MFLVGDVGGTKTFLALFDAKGNSLKEEKFFNESFLTFDHLLEHFLKDQKVEGVYLALAGFVQDEQCKMTNLPWMIEKTKLMKKLKTKSVTLLNDLEASGYGLFVLKKKDFFPLNDVKESSFGRKIIFSVGTGVGQAFIYSEKGKSFIFTSEGGHADFVFQGKEGEKLFSYLKKKYGHVSYERVLSGRGIEILYEFLAKGKKLSCKEILEKGLNRKSDQCEKVLDLFCSIYGAAVGNMALQFLPFSGIYLAGGLSLRLFHKLKGKNFMRSFLNKGRMSSLLSSMPIKVVMNEKIALLGAFQARKPFSSLEKRIRN